MPNLQHLDCYLKSVFTSSSPDNDDWNAMFAQEPLYEPEGSHDCVLLMTYVNNSILVIKYVC